MAHYLYNMHVILAMIKPKVSDADYMKILSSVTLPMTTVEVVQYVDNFAGVGVDAVSVSAPDTTSDPPVDPTADSTDLSIVSEPTLDTTGTDTTEGGRNPTSRTNKLCQACNMFFENNDLRVAHIKIYQRDLVVSCRKIRFSLTMDQHLAVSHTICSACSKVFADHKLLQAHHQKCKFSRPDVTLTDNSSFYLPPQENIEQLCILCHQKFSTWSLYFAHIRTH